MNLFLFFLVNLLTLAPLFILFGYGLEEANKFAKYLIAFFFGMVVMEMIL